MDGSEAERVEAAKAVVRELAPAYRAYPGVLGMAVGKDDAGEVVLLVLLDGTHPETMEKLPAEASGFKLVPRTIGTIHFH